MTFPSAQSLGVLRRQFVLSEEAIDVPPDWRVQRCGRWLLHHHEELPVVELTGATKRGWLVGWPILGTSICEAELSVGNNGWDHVESALYRLGGCWLSVVVGHAGERLYVDPVGSMPCVFALDRKLLASSTTALMAGGAAEVKDVDLERLLDVWHTDLWYPFGLTLLRNARRLLPNHYLDLGAWSAARLWPPAGSLQTRSREDVVAIVLSAVRRQIQAVASKDELYLPLTAGRDSRMLLACARAVSNRVRAHTIRLPGTGGQIDAQIAPRVARRAAVRHELLEHVEAGAEELELFQYRVGYCVAGQVWRTVRTRRQLEARRLSLAGMGGEIARAYYWRPSDVDAVALTPEDILDRMHMPRHPSLVSSAAEWLSGLPFPTVQRLQSLDLLYMEQRLGCWAAPQRLGLAECPIGISPMNHREVIKAMLSLDPEHKRVGRLQEDITRLAWPELLRLPYNAPTPWMRGRRLLVTVGRRGRRFLGKVGQKLSKT